MAQTGDLVRLAQRRRALVEQSTTLREQVALDFAAVNASVSWVETGYSMVRSGWVLWPLLAGLAGLLVARKSGGWLSRAGRLLSWWRLAKKLRSLFALFSAPRG